MTGEQGQGSWGEGGEDPDPRHPPPYPPSPLLLVRARPVFHHHTALNPSLLSCFYRCFYKEEVAQLCCREMACKSEHSTHDGEVVYLQSSVYCARHERAPFQMAVRRISQVRPAAAAAGSPGLEPMSRNHTASPDFLLPRPAGSFC